MILRLLFRALAVAAVVWAGRELMRRWVDGPDQPAVAGNWERWEPTRAGTGSGGVDGEAEDDGTRTNAGTVTPEAPAPKKASSATAPARRATAPSGGAWVAPNGSGETPATHPVKAKLSSHLYRVPGMPMYDRMVPDRCYASPEAAETDGFSRAKR